MVYKIICKFVIFGMTDILNLIVEIYDYSFTCVYIDILWVCREEFINW